MDPKEMERSPGELLELLEAPWQESGHPGLHTLRRLLAAETTPREARSLHAHLKRCMACSSRYHDLALQASAFLDEHPFDSIEAAMHASGRSRSVLPAAHNESRTRPAAIKAPKESFWGWLSELLASHRLPALATAAAVAGLALLLIWPRGMEPSPEELAPGSSAGSAISRGTRLKTAYGLSFHLQSGGRVEPGRPGAVCHPGDRIQLRYSSPRQGHLLVISLDSGGAVTPFYDDRGRSLDIEPGVARLLEGSIILDDAIGPERVIGCFSEDRIETEAALAAGRRALDAAGGDPQAVKELDLPCEQVGFLIKKRWPSE